MFSTKNTKLFDIFSTIPLINVKSIGVVLLKLNFTGFVEWNICGYSKESNSKKSTPPHHSKHDFEICNANEFNWYEL